ncbi:hypothetical protein WJX77_007282 [Trebouxia sp. C0004]
MACSSELDEWTSRVLRLVGSNVLWRKSDSDTSSTATAHSASADTTADPQQTQSSHRDTARLTYEADMRKLRRKWQIQQAEKLAARAKAEAIKDANKAVSIEAHRCKVAEMKELRMQIHEEKRRLQMAELAQRQALAAQFRAATEAIYTDLQSRRQDDLLEDSKEWITPETLDARIQRAIENPIELYETPPPQDWSYKG